MDAIVRYRKQIMKISRSPVDFVMYSVRLNFGFIVINYNFMRRLEKLIIVISVIKFVLLCAYSGHSTADTVPYYSS